MDNKYPTDSDLTNAIAADDSEAWSLFVHRYHGRLLNYARSRVKQQADAEDMVQETFISFLKILQKNQENKQFESLDNYLFTILRNAIYSQHRNRWSKSVCLLQDAYCSNDTDSVQNASEQIVCDEPSVTRYITQKEQAKHFSDSLLEALQEILTEYQQTLNFRNLKICDLVFYSSFSNKESANILGLGESAVRVFKHRFLKRLHGLVTMRLQATTAELPPVDLLSELWQEHRLTCPKYTTLGNFMLENIEPEWFEYIDFHLTTFGCHFCRAAFKDLQKKQLREQKTCFENRIMASTIGFFRKTN